MSMSCIHVEFLNLDQMRLRLDTPILYLYETIVFVTLHLSVYLYKNKQQNIDMMKQSNWDKFGFNNLKASCEKFDPSQLAYIL